MALDNRIQNAQNTDVGVKISKPGYDARKTSGQNVIYNSSWPTLAVAFETTITNPLTSLLTSGTVAHNLTYVPFTMVWAIGTDTKSGLGTPAVRRIPGCADIDRTNVYLKTGGLTGLETDFLYTATQLHIKCFQLDLSVDVDYLLAPGETFKTPYDNSFGIKVVKPRKNINSTDLRDFVIHSRCQGAMVLAVKTQDTNNPANPTITQYTSKLKTPVWVYGYVRSNTGKYRWAALGGQAYPLTASDGYTSSITYIGGAGDNGATLVVLRDPMFAPNTIIGTY